LFCKRFAALNGQAESDDCTEITFRELIGINIIKLLEVKFDNIG
jgi:hypothetical protein